MIISIEGNIGCGKSTQLDFLKHTYDVKCENVEEWKSEGWLEAYYENPKYHAFGFQMRVMHDHMNRKFTEHSKCTIVERSPYTCNFIFGNLLYEDKLLTNLEYDLMDKYYQSISWKHDACIYIRTSPDICFERIKKRDRQNEDMISIEYLQKLHRKHDEYLIRTNSTKQFSTYIVDGDKCPEDIKIDIDKILCNCTG
tara:strand:+ start:666 stop:1256 length:591 start_codon:yes stop_codon:yes gene_type:complete